MPTENDAPRVDLIRMLTTDEAELRFDAEQDASSPTLGRLTGYAAVFDTPTVIDSWEGKFIETIAPGAFRKTLRARGDRVKVLFNHGFDPSIGDKPLGKPDVMMEDERGLYVEVPLDDTSYNRDLVASLRSGALDGQSFRFSVTRDHWTQPKSDTGELPVRTIKEVNLFEFGPVTFPAYEATTAGVRAREAYLAWRTTHSQPPVPADAADSGTSDGDTDDAADSGTSSETNARPIKALALARQRARMLAAKTE